MFAGDLVFHPQYLEIQQVFCHAMEHTSVRMFRQDPGIPLRKSKNVVQDPELSRSYMLIGSFPQFLFRVAISARIFEALKVPDKRVCYNQSVTLPESCNILSFVLKLET